MPSCTTRSSTRWTSRLTRRSWGRSASATGPNTSSSSGPERAQRAGSRLRRGPHALQKARTAYIEGGMNKIIQDTRQAPPKAANSSAADQAVLASLRPDHRELVESLMADYPELSAEKALAMLNEAGM